MSQLIKVLFLIAVLELLFINKTLCSDSTNIKVEVQKIEHGNYKIVLKNRDIVIDSIIVLSFMGFGNLKPIIVNNSIFYIQVIPNTSFTYFHFVYRQFSENGFSEEKYCHFTNRRERGDLNITEVKLNEEELIIYYNDYTQIFKINKDFFDKLCNYIPGYVIPKR